MTNFLMILLLLLIGGIATVGVLLLLIKALELKD